MTTPWAVVAAALGASFLTGIIALGLELWRERSAARRDATQRLREACTQLNAHAISFMFLIHGQQLTGIYRQGIGEVLDVALYRRKPLDPMELTEQFLVDQRPMLLAQAVIDVLGPQELIRGASSVLLAVNGVRSDVTKVNETLTRQSAEAPVLHRAAKYFGKAQTELPPELTSALQDGVRRLGQEVRRFAQLTRKCLNVNDADAVIRAYPELFAERPPEVTTVRVSDANDSESS
ncbi:MAG TPA: hypothetical protein VED59_08180 [Acidimicrobiales bacterium]|nr:hypothetical protein [Acidimicrobiales bacterium]